jgi:hypothetical protein
VNSWNPRRWTRITDAIASRSSCFTNAGTAAERYGWRYVEGIAYLLPCLPPTHHAWCVTDDDEVVEVTWPWPGARLLRDRGRTDDDR